MPLPPQDGPINPMQGGAGNSPAAGGPPSPMGQPIDQMGGDPGAAPGGAPPPGGAPQGPGGGINAAQLIDKAGQALKSGQISPDQFKALLTKLGLPPAQQSAILSKYGVAAAAAGGQKPPGAPPAPAAGPTPGGPSQAWGS